MWQFQPITSRGSVMCPVSAVAAAVAGLDNKGGSVSNNSRNDNLGTERYYYYPYYIGSTYWPVIWWSNNCWKSDRSHVVL